MRTELSCRYSVRGASQSWGKKDQVLDGITTSDKIVSSWTQDIFDGASVRIIDENGNIAAN
jgi:hypothetical protein